MLLAIQKITRGTVEPGVDLPLEYDQMIFDPETQQWKSKMRQL